MRYFIFVTFPFKYKFLAVPIFVRFSTCVLQGVLKMKVYRRNCRRKTSQCEVLYTGKEDAIHQWSKEICAGDEIG